ncbi:hypothetical protein FHU10_1013 [Serratia fonticola]|uniref:Fimbrial adhesin MrpH C-terminal domain-containing protein n=1 Tax=Serratia fonticola TaxID=47917 RepID=A0A542BK29_SERFO|nr:hypothetical protein FHU09_1435 [Serratia fonticola]TQI99036.1 hypothetical protein FHU11_4614 [Serratia fonticola]TVZ68561.1 hypothetical protein FHU10_1013 [Serratia fonticola]
MKLIGTALLKKTAVIVGLLMPACGYATGIDVSWTGPKQMTISAQPDGIGGSTTSCKAGTTVSFYAILVTTTGMYQRFIASAGGVPSGNCSEALAKVLPISFTLQPGETHFFGLGKEVNKRPPDGPSVNVSLEYQRGTGDGWKPQPPPGPACSLLNSSVDINYGDIQANSVPGLKKSAYLYVSCTSSATIRVTVIGYTASTGIKLRTDGSLTADVFVRDQPANIGSLERIGANQMMAIPISSALKVNGNLAGGAFRGSAVINMDIL